MRALLRLAGLTAMALMAASGTARPGETAIRLHGSVEPVRSHPLAVPRLTGTGNGSLVIVHLAKGGTMVKRGDLLVEFDRAAQIKNAHDREAEYRDFAAQIEKKRGELITARAQDESEITTAENAVKSAQLAVDTNDIQPPITAEQNTLTLEESKAKLQQLRKTFDLKRRADAADVKSLEIQRDRAQNAWKHAEENAGKMRITSPIDGMVVLKSTWKQGTMGEVQEGEEVRSGLPILDVVDASVMRVRARVNQADIAGLAAGQAAKITLDSYPSRTFNGRLEQLSKVGATSSMSNRVRTFLAVFSIEGSDEHLMPDLAAAVDVLPVTEREASAGRR
ncbi:MAG TPA: HlyD family efflux transporter periplasmic adaptor subunit [Vicinamibacterales bacterium]|nr:HlyD family efflux transporter periplasmic adaptor subunit [Vicinamibacterales bacterium]